MRKTRRSKPASAHPGLAFSKGETGKAIKRKKRQAEIAQIDAVRKHDVKRDGWCRLLDPSMNGFGPWGDCRKTSLTGRSEMAHLGQKKRAHTRGQAPEVRHTTSHTVMLCDRHHRDYDQGQLEIDLITVRGADGMLGFSYGDQMFMELRPRLRQWR